MSSWSLSHLLSSLHADIEQKLAIARASFAHPGTKGDASEGVWIELLSTYLPKRYEAAKAHIVDSQGQFSQQIDVAIFDRQYSPFVFQFQGQSVIPAESVYGIFEAKQVLNSTHVKYAQEKVSSVRRLHRTSLPIPHAGGVYPPRPLPHIYGGLLTFESDWSPALGDPLRTALAVPAAERLDLGCVAAHGTFQLRSVPADGVYDFTQTSRAATAFLFELISRLQANATVPMIDVTAYAKWLAQS